MSECSAWFEQTFKECYDESGLVDKDKFTHLVQVILDNEADEESKRLFREKVDNCMHSCGCYEKEKCLQDAIREKLCKQQSNMPTDLADKIRKSINC